MKIIIHDETKSGSILNQVRLKVSKDQITIKELIRLRVFQEAQEYNARKSAYFRGLVRPIHAQPILNGYKLDPKYKIDPLKQYYVAMDAFRRHGFYIMIDEKRIEDPEFEIPVNSEIRISFMKMVPLVEG